MIENRYIDKSENDHINKSFIKKYPITKYLIPVNGPNCGNRKYHVGGGKVVLGN